MWGKEKHVEHTPEELDGKVTASIVVNAVDRQTRTAKIVIIEKQTEQTVFKAEFTTRLNERLAFESARDIVKAFVRANDYYIDLETTNVEIPVVRTINHKRSR
ncbi:MULTISPECIES: hypothetical protein [unclassified Cytobacillus]|uniref:hypothetical protein n=1 Tax=unclassified Cytobacillus TaxID=2675268 RepID=UPI00203C85A9|nr:hypothetical protein [Cytobacillus sp. AMY 15.2]MCM3093826.1 hypothetical protein [Cytobacillus sp. AMY 15.2]